MVIPSRLLDDLLARISGARRVICLTHKNPDGDAVGSLLGMGMMIERRFPDIEVHYFNKDKINGMFRFLPGCNKVENSISSEEGDLYIFLDSAEPKLIGIEEEYPHVFDGRFPSINIDHHPTNALFAGVNILVPDACSACEILYYLALSLDWQLSGDIATCLLTGVYTDTGGLLHSNTTVSAYRTSAALLRAGARHQEIIRAMFRTSSVNTLKLWGKVLEGISITDEGAAVSAVKEDDFRAAGAHFAQLTGVVDYVNSVPGTRFSMILSEREGLVKGSLRTLRDDVDVSKMAAKFNGGGHKRAAGFSVPGKLKSEVRWKIVESK